MLYTPRFAQIIPKIMLTPHHSCTVTVMPPSYAIVAVLSWLCHQLLLLWLCRCGLVVILSGLDAEVVCIVVFVVLIGECQGHSIPRLLQNRCLICKCQWLPSAVLVKLWHNEDAQAIQGTNCGVGCNKQTIIKRYMKIDWGVWWIGESKVGVLEVGGSKTLLRMLKIDLTGLICKTARAEKS